MGRYALVLLFAICCLSRPPRRMRSIVSGLEVGNAISASSNGICCVIGAWSDPAFAVRLRSPKVFSMRYAPCSMQNFAHLPPLRCTPSLIPLEPGCACASVISQSCSNGICCLLAQADSPLPISPSPFLPFTLIYLYGMFPAALIF